MVVFYFFAVIVVWLGILSLRNGIDFRRYLKAETGIGPVESAPYVSVIAPCRGADKNFSASIQAILHQEYPAYEVLFVIDDADDMAAPEIRHAMLELENVKSPVVRLIVAGEAVDCGQKVHNLRIATRQAAPEAEVFVFVDTDVCPERDWLRSLIAPLVDDRVGATTGYRWFIPLRGGFATHLRSVWNASIASALGTREDRNFCWGGSMAIRKRVFEKQRIEEHWSGTVSDDFSLTRVLQENRLPIRFVPKCLVPSFEDCTLRELLEFSNRQLKITRTYAPHLWRPLLLGSLLFSIVFFGGLMIAMVQVIRGSFYRSVLGLLLVIFILGALKSLVRLQGVTSVLNAHQALLHRTLPAHMLLWPIASLLFLLNCVIAGFSREIEWRGITYQLKSPSEAVIIARKPSVRC